MTDDEKDFAERLELAKKEIQEVCHKYSVDVFAVLAQTGQPFVTGFIAQMQWVDMKNQKKIIADGGMEENPTKTLN